VIGNTLTGDVSHASALRLRWPYVRRVLADAMIESGLSREQGMPVLRLAAARYLAPLPEVTAATLAGATPASIAARICGYFGFKGGGYAVDGASSSSLLAVASACAALTGGDLDVALAGGVDVSLDPFELVGLAKAGLLAATDVRVYDENGTGFLPAEGCGVVVLMRAADARSAGLPVYAEIAGWGMSSAGQPALEVPDPHSQLLALRRAYQQSGIDPADVGLIEGQGAATAPGDLAGWMPGSHAIPGHQLDRAKSAFPEVSLVEPGVALLGQDPGKSLTIQIDPLVAATVQSRGHVLEHFRIDLPHLT